MKKLTQVLAAGGVASALGLIFLLPGETIQSADHLDPPTRTSPMSDDTPDRAADIADVYAWAQGSNVNIALTFAGPAPDSQAATYDRDVLYRVLVSTDGDPASTQNTMEIRFGKSAANGDGVQVRGIPGLGTLQGPVETNLNNGGVTVRAGLFDDPFFFDLQGFQETRDTGEIRFDSDRDFFAGSNVTAVVIQIPVSNFSATGPISIWSDTQRFGGNL